MKASIASVFPERCCLGQQQSPSAALGALHAEIDRAEFEEAQVAQVAQVPSSLLVKQRSWHKELLKLTDIGHWTFTERESNVSDVQVLSS